MKSEAPYATSYNEGSRNMQNLGSKQSNSVILNPSDLPEGVKMQSPFSPTTHTRLVDIHNKAKRFEESVRSRARNHNLNSTNKSKMSHSHQRAD